MDALERKEIIEAALSILKNALIETATSMALYEDKMIFFGTDDYMQLGDINKCPRFSVNIKDLVR